MDKLVYLLPVLGCAVMMGAMMFMMRGNHASQSNPAQPDPNTQEDIAMLRAEVATLRAQQAEPAGEADRGSRP